MPTTITRNKLTPAQVEAIRWRYAQENHPTQLELAAEFGVNPSQVSRAVRGLAWPDANGPIFPHRPRG
jgi:DNA-binding MarR family transcriptional regulator